MGFWDALTWQGKAIVAAALVFVFLLVGLTYGGSEDPPSTPLQPVNPAPGVGPGQVTLPQPTIASGIIPVATAATAPASQAQPTPTGAPEPSPTDVPTAPTVAPAPPTAGPPPPSPTSEAPPPPLPTAVAAGCNVETALSSSSPSAGQTLSVTARLTCDGDGVAGSEMTSFFYAPNSTSSCAGISNVQGLARCSISVPGGSPGQLVTVTPCFNHNSQIYCGQAGYTPQ
jgi:hypothetical protein